MCAHPHTSLSWAHAVSLLKYNLPLLCVMGLGIFLLYFVFLNAGSDSLHWFCALENGKCGFRVADPLRKLGKPGEDQAKFN